MSLYVETRERNMNRGPTPVWRKTSRLKVKTGCTTCKLRRVKCDENRPFCKKCSGFGRKCGGYDSSVHRSEPPDNSLQPHSTVPKCQAKPLPAIIPQPIDSLHFGSEREARYFRVFRDQAAHELAGAFQLYLWNRLVLQVSQDEPFVKHAIIALGALNLAHKSRPIKASFCLRTDPRDPDDHYRFALEQYDRAVRYMRTSISDLDRDLWRALLSCLFIYCFECFQGRRDLAISNAKSGQLLVQEQIMLQARRKMKGNHQKTHFIEGTIIQAFGRLDLLILTAADTRSTAEHRGFEPEGCIFLTRMPSKFGSIYEAKNHFELLMRKIGHFMGSALETIDTRPSGASVHESEKAAQVPPGTSIYSYQGAVLRAEYLSAHAKLSADLHAWFVAFATVVHKLAGIKEEDTSWQAMARLYIHSHAHKIMLASMVSTSQMYYDDFIPDFKTIVFHASPIFHRSSKMIQPNFTFDISLKPPVAFVAFCCRDWTVRRQALALLKLPSTQQDVFWNKDMLAAQAQMIMEMEEEGLRFREMIPEKKRARTLNVDVDEVKRSANVGVVQGRGEEQVVCQKVIKW
ncbi:uncharacterized protein LY89DRAFT_720432 [Mollisia scopiformis]|uniref:Zn(2)-C6 fungal-type domain-containing protein n=1 Tax=Mollisia scopiformis TaxID=149040 RepID=A0A194X4B6_MOLSC|nr:uncharacterized protein LY89DRAFT_720432 [Mollisia scopiformis]KUJ15020.1 hypothetical protein LY89DRAFT_720432 [Mollisia scopiformis]